METTYIIDGFNLIRNAPDLRGAELEQGTQAARDLLESLLRRFQARVRCRVVLVYDGRAQGEVNPPSSGGFEVHLARPPRTADEVLLDEVRRNEGEGTTVVVTSDMTDIGHRIRGLRVVRISAEEFAGRLRLDEPDVLEKPDRVDAAEIERWMRLFGGDGRPGPPDGSMSSRDR